MDATIEPMGIDDVEQARADRVDVVGPDGMLAELTKRVLETALEEEMTEHLNYERADRATRAELDVHAAAARGTLAGNERNGTRSKTVLTAVGPVEIDVPRDREGTFEPKIVRKRQRRLDGIDQLVLSLAARGLPTGEIAAHFAEVYGASVSKDAISRITEKVVAEMNEWQHRPLDRVCPATIRMWWAAWSEFVPFLNCDVEIRRVICTTNAIWVFGWARRPGLASRTDRPALALNAIDLRVLDSNCRAGRLGAGPGVWLEESLHDSTQICRRPGPAARKVTRRRRSPSSPHTLSPASTRTNTPARSQSWPPRVSSSPAPRLTSPRRA